MASFSSGGFQPDPKVSQSLESMLAMQQARDRWFWRVIGLLVSVATVTSAVFSVLGFSCGVSA